METGSSPTVHPTSFVLLSLCNCETMTRCCCSTLPLVQLVFSFVLVYMVIDDNEYKTNRE